MNTSAELPSDVFPVIKALDDLLMLYDTVSHFSVSADQVNDVNFENMSNDDAVRILREIVSKTG